jgi:predicted metal-dependent hydrolase
VAAEGPPRYSSVSFPAYAFIPGQHPHPRRDPKGHSYGVAEPTPDAVSKSEDYRYAVDLYNFGYWWECHEVLEGLWRAVGPKTEQGSFFQAVIDLAAGNLKLRMGKDSSAITLWSSALARLDTLPSPYMGLDLHRVRSDLRSLLDAPASAPVLLRLTL